MVTAIAHALIKNAIALCFYDQRGFIHRQPQRICDQRLEVCYQRGLIYRQPQRICDQRVDFLY
jgi:hypothetical protein